jgi:hypothetical protein
LGGVRVGRVFLARAAVSESARERSQVLRRLSEARREAAHPILCWLILDARGDVPSAAASSAVLPLVGSLLNLCESLTLIVIGDGLEQRLLRATLRGLTRAHILRVRVVDSLDAAAKIAGDPAIDVAQLERAAGSSGAPAISSG